MTGALRQQWGRLTDDDLAVIAGNRDAFVGRVQERYGIAKEEAENRIEKWLRFLAETDAAHGAAPPKTRTGKP